MANILAAIERQVERFIERPLMRLFGARVEPSDVAKHLGRAMEDGRELFSGKFVGPNRYEVRLSPEDLKNFESYKTTLLNDLSEYLVDLAPRRDLTMLGRPQITLVADSDLSRGEVRVTARLEDPTQQEHTRAFTAPLSPVGAAPPVPTAPEGWLMLRDRQFPLTKIVTTLGRSIDNDVILEGDDVSRHHAQITRQNGKFVLTDLKSANGTRVNGQPLKGDRTLRDGDEICLAAICMSFRAP